MKITLALALLAAACSGSGDATSTSPPAPPATPPETTTSTVPATAAPELTVLDVLDAYLASMAGGDAESAYALFAPNAVWTRDGVQIRLDAPVPDEFAWLAGAFGLPERAAGSDVVRAVLATEVTLRTRPEVARCRVVGSAASCDYSSTDAISSVSGTPSAGQLTVQADGEFITHLELTSSELGVPGPEYDAFLRWGAIRDPDLARDNSIPVGAELQVELIDQWRAAGSPDVAPPVLEDPVAVVGAFFTARNTGDWASMAALMGGAALRDPFGSRDEFDAAQLLERVVTPIDCEVLLENESIGAQIGCDVEVTDIIVAAAGITATNPNQSSLQVKDGRVTRLPEFIPSSFQAESAIEAWAVANEPVAYAAACPDGIAGQSPIDGLPCARFIVDHRAEWTEIVAALDLG